MGVLELVGTGAAVLSAVGVPIAYQQLRTERAHLKLERAAKARSAVNWDEAALFAPQARFLGFDARLVDRTAEVAVLVRLVRERRSVIVVEGMAGVGKTTLAARLSREMMRTHQVRWVFCEEKGPALTVAALAKALAATAEEAVADALRALTGAQCAGEDSVIDAVIDYLAREHMLLVLDGFEAVIDPGIRLFVDRLAHSQTASSLIVTSQVRVQSARGVPPVRRVEVTGLAAGDARALLRACEVTLTDAAARAVWEWAGDGNPLALSLFAGRARDIEPEELALALPGSTDDLEAWIAPAYDALSAESQAVARAIAFAFEPMATQALQKVLAPLEPTAALVDLGVRFLVTTNAGRHEMHGAVRDFVSVRTGDAERADLAARLTTYYRRQARTVFLEGLGRDEPSYGTLYLESFPDYFADTARHIHFVDDLLDRLTDQALGLDVGDRILVLGSGDGTHDPGFAKHGLDVTNLEIQPEIAALGRAKAATLPASISYVIGDMTAPLTELIPDRSMAAVFNIGSSFGYEDQDEANAAVFRHAARVLREGAPFVFEYVNGPHWVDKRVQRQIDTTDLPNGSTRTEVSITNPEAGTSLTLIGLRRRDGSGGWFSHFMHYYRLDEVTAMMAQAGLLPVAVLGATGGRVVGEPFDEAASEAMVIIATVGGRA